MKKKYRVLVVEDDHVTREVVGQTIRQEGYEVTLASSGEQALELLRQSLSSNHPYDVVVSDIRMGDVDGIQVLHEAREQEQPPSVILLTGYPAIESAVDALRARACDYLPKPCDMIELLACLEKAVVQRETEQRLAQDSTALSTITRLLEPATDDDLSEEDGSTIETAQSLQERFVRLGILNIDCYRKKVFLRGVPIHVTPTEYRLLYILALELGEVVPFGEIARYTHDDDVDDEQAHSLLRWHVRNLNRKMGADYIVKVRGTGYMLGKLIYEEDRSST